MFSKDTIDNPITLVYHNNSSLTIGMGLWQVIRAAA